MLMQLQAKVCCHPLATESATALLLTFLAMLMKFLNMKADLTTVAFVALSALLLVKLQERSRLHPVATKSATLELFTQLSMPVELLPMKSGFATIALAPLSTLILMDLQEKAWNHPLVAETATC